MVPPEIGDVAAGRVLVLVALQRVSAGGERERAALDGERVLAAQGVIDRLDGDVAGEDRRGRLRW